MAKVSAMDGSMALAVKTLLLLGVWRPELAAVFFLVGTVYVQGWRQLHQLYQRQVHDVPLFASWWSLSAFIAGLALLVIAFTSPLDHLATRYFLAHAVQHLLLIAWAPCLLIVANPVQALLRGLPLPITDRLETWVADHPTWHERVRRATAPGVTWFLFAACFWIWYDPLVHQIVLQHGWLRILEKLTLLGVAMLYWWHIAGAAPYLHQPLPLLVRAIYTLVGAWPIKLVGGILLFSQADIYTYPASFQLSGLVINDQAMGAILVWAVGGMAYSTAAVLLLRRWLGREAVKPPLPESLWATEEALLAPGLKK